MVLHLFLQLVLRRELKIGVKVGGEFEFELFWCLRAEDAGGVNMELDRLKLMN